MAYNETELKEAAKDYCTNEGYYADEPESAQAVIQSFKAGAEWAALQPKEAITPQSIKNKIVGEANWRSTNGHGGVDDITRDNFILAAEFGYSLAQPKQEAIEGKELSEWVKASDELPEDKADIFFKVKGMMDMGFFDTKRKEFYSSRHHHAGYIEQLYSEIEWLKPVIIDKKGKKGKRGVGNADMVNPISEISEDCNHEFQTYKQCCYCGAFDNGKEIIIKRVQSNIEKLRNSFSEWYFGIKEETGKPPLAMQIFYWFETSKVVKFDHLPQFEQKGNINLKIDFTEGIIAEDTEGFVGVIEGLKIVETGKTKQDVLEECLTSIKVLLAYNSGIDIRKGNIINDSEMPDVEVLCKTFLPNQFELKSFKRKEILFLESAFEQGARVMYNTLKNQFEDKHPSQ